MLTIGNYLNIKNNYQTRTSNNSKHVKFVPLLHFDTVSFNANTKSDFYIASYLRKHSDCLGDAFKQIFDIPFGKFLEENGLCVKYSQATKSVRVEKGQPRGEVETHIGHLQVLGQDGNVTNLLSVDGLTKKDINVRLMRVLLETKTDFKISDELRINTINVTNVINDFWGKWTMAIRIDRGYDANAKAKDLQVALNELMP